MPGCGGLRSATPTLRTAGIFYKKGLQVKDRYSLSFVGWVQRSVTHHFAWLWWVTLRCTHPTNCLITTGIFYKKGLQVKDRYSLNFVGWVQRSVTHHFARLWWVTLRYTHPTNYELLNLMALTRSMGTRSNPGQSFNPENPGSDK